MTNFGKKALTDLTVPLAEDVLPKLANRATLSVINLKEKISGWGCVRVGKRFTLFISNEDMDDSLWIVKSLGNWGLLIDGGTGTVNMK